MYSRLNSYKKLRPYSMHIKSCREVVSAVDEALKKHKTLIAKQAEEKKAAAVDAAQRELVVQTSQPQAFPDDHMDVDMDSEVKYMFSILFLSFILHLYRIFYQKFTPLRDRHRHLQGLQGGLVDEHAYRVATAMIYHLKRSLFLFNPRNRQKMRQQHHP